MKSFFGLVLTVWVTSLGLASRERGVRAVLYFVPPIKITEQKQSEDSELSVWNQPVRVAISILERETEENERLTLTPLSEHCLKLEVIGRHPSDACLRIVQSLNTKLEELHLSSKLRSNDLNAELLAKESRLKEEEKLESFLYESVGRLESVTDLLDYQKALQAEQKSRLKCLNWENHLRASVPKFEILVAPEPFSRAGFPSPVVLLVGAFTAALFLRTSPGSKRTS